VRDDHTLAGVEGAKFVRPVCPEEVLEIEVVPTHNPLAYDAIVRTGQGGTEPCSHFRLLFRQEEPAPGVMAAGECTSS
jgi:hypothetical protein